MVHMPVYAEAIADELGHAGPSTQSRGEAGGLGALEQDPLEPVLGPAIHLGRTAGSGLRTRVIATGFSVDPVPASNVASVDLDQARHVEGLMALHEKSDGTNPTAL